MTKQTNVPSPTPLLARVVMALVILTALMTLAAAILFVVALLPMPAVWRPWLSLALILIAGAAVICMIWRRAQGGDERIRQHLTRLFTPLGLHLRSSEQQAGVYAGVYREMPLRAAYSIAGTPQRPIYHLELAIPRETPWRLALGMAKFQPQFDERAFGASVALVDPPLAGLQLYSDAPATARDLLALPDVQQAVRTLLSPEAPGVRNLTLGDGGLTLRYRHLSLKGLNPQLVRAWADALIAIASQEQMS